MMACSSSYFQLTIEEERDIDSISVNKEIGSLSLLIKISENISIYLRVCL